MRLPFDVERLDSRPIIYDARAWRQTPDLRISSVIDPYLDVIAMETANEVSEKADNNLLRTFHYNMMSSRDFMNRDFERLVQFVAEFIDMLYATRRLSRPDQDLLSNISAAVSLHSCKQVLDFPELEEICARSGDSRMMHALDTNIGRYQQLVRDLDQLHNADSRDIRTTRNERSDFRSQYAGASGGGRGYSRETRETTRNIPARDTGGEYATDTRSFQRDDFSTGRRVIQGSRGFIERHREDNGYRFVPQPVFREETTRTREFENNRHSEYEAAPPAPPPPEMTPPPPPPPAPEETSSKVQTGRCVEPIPAFRGIIGSFPILNENTMDIKAHSKVYDIDEGQETATKQQVLRTLSLAQAVNDSMTNSESIDDHVVIREEATVCSTVQSLINYISDEATAETIQLSGENKAGERKIVHSFGIVDNSIVGFPVLNDINKLLGKCSSLKETVQAIKRMHEIANTAPLEAAFATDIRAAADIYDRILTTEVNSYLRDVMKLSDGNAVDSITQDFDDLLTQIQASGNNELINGVLAFFSQLNANMYEALLPEHGVVESVKETQDLEENNSGFCVMPLSYIVTHIPFTMKELGFNIETSKAIMATDGNGFIRAALDVSKLQAAGKLENSLRLMVTRDRQALRVNTYPGRKDVIILSAYK